METFETRSLSSVNFTENSTTAAAETADENVQSYINYAAGFSFLLLLGFIALTTVYARKRSRSRTGKAKRRKVLATAPIQEPHPALNVVFKTDLHPRYYRNERNSIQCFPLCKEWGEYSKGRLEGKEHMYYTRGECAGHIEVQVKLPKEMAQSMLFLGRLTGTNVQSDILQYWECSSSLVESLTTKGYTVGTIADSVDDSPDIVSLTIAFKPATQWKFEGRIGKSIPLYYEIYCLREQSGISLQRLNLPWLTTETFNKTCTYTATELESLSSQELSTDSVSISGSEGVEAFPRDQLSNENSSESTQFWIEGNAYISHSAGSVDNASDLEVGNADTTPSFQCDVDLMDRDVLQILAGDEEFFDKIPSSSSSLDEQDSSSLFGSSVQTDSSSSYSEMSSANRQFVVLAKYTSSTFTCGTTKSLKSLARTDKGVSAKNSALESPQLEIQV